MSLTAIVALALQRGATIDEAEAVWQKLQNGPPATSVKAAIREVDDAIEQVRAQDTELRGCPICLRIQKWKPGDLFGCLVCGTRLVPIDESFGNR